MTSNTHAKRQFLPALPLAVLFLVAFVLPLLALVFISLFRTPQFLAMGPDQYVRFFLDTFSIRVLADTLQLGAEVAMLTLFLAYPLGIVYVASRPFVRSIVTFLILLPLLTSTVVRTFAWTHCHQ